MLVASLKQNEQILLQPTSPSTPIWTKKKSSNPTQQQQPSPSWSWCSVRRRHTTSGSSFTFLNERDLLKRTFEKWFQSWSWKVCIYDSRSSSFLPSLQ